MHKTLKMFASIAIIGLFSSGCFRYVMPTSTPLTYEPKTMDILGNVKGEVTQWYVFGFIPLGWDSFSSEEAIKIALASGPEVGHAILNPQIDNEVGTILGLVTWQSIRVSGAAVRYRSNGFNVDGTLKMEKERK